MHFNDKMLECKHSQQIVTRDTTLLNKYKHTHSRGILQHHTFRHTGTHVRQPKLAKNVEALQQNGGWLLLLYV